MKKWKFLFFALRPKQWVKNFFVFLPLIFGKKLFVFPINLKVGCAFLLFCLASSAVYLVNDVIDRKKDKSHPFKRIRPIASGKVSKEEAILAALALTVLSAGLSLYLNVIFGLVICFYFAFNFLYSTFLKRIVIVDVFCISVFFLLRVIAGSLVAEVAISHWIVLMTGLLALFLGFNKRRQDLKLLSRRTTPIEHVVTRYNRYFIDQISAVITSSIVMTYMLYTIDARTVHEFGSKHLMLSIPFVYYGIFRYLYLIHRYHKEGDPTRILLSDGFMQLNLALWAMVCITIIYFGL